MHARYRINTILYISFFLEAQTLLSIFVTCGVYCPLQLFFLLVLFSLIRYPSSTLSLFRSIVSNSRDCGVAVDVKFAFISYMRYINIALHFCWCCSYFSSFCFLGFRAQSPLSLALLQNVLCSSINRLRHSDATELAAEDTRKKSKKMSLGVEKPPQKRFDNTNEMPKKVVCVFAVRILLLCDLHTRSWF